MIVVDSNVLAYYWVNGPLTRLARLVWEKDPEWHVPILWRSEMRSILTGYFREGTLSGEQAIGVMAAAEQSLSDREHTVASEDVFGVVAGTDLSAYDAEFVSLANALSVPLVTSDKAILKAFPDRALTMQAFVGEKA